MKWTYVEPYSQFSHIVRIGDDQSKKLYGVKKEPKPTHPEIVYFSQQGFNGVSWDLHGGWCIIISQ